MNSSAAIADPLFRRACGQRARPSDPQRTARVRFGSSGLRAPVSRRGLAISRRTVMDHADSSCLIAGALNLAGISTVAAQISWMLFVVGIVLLVIYWITGRTTRPV